MSIAAASNPLRVSVLGGYRRLMRLRKRVFAGDQFAIDQARIQLRMEFMKHKGVTDRRELGMSTYIHVCLYLCMEGGRECVDVETVVERTTTHWCISSFLSHIFLYIIRTPYRRSGAWY